MDDQQRKAWTKQDGEDASRLLAEMVKRAKDASGGVRPEQIRESVVENVPQNDNGRSGGSGAGGSASSHRSCLSREGIDDREGNGVRDEADRVLSHVADTASSDRHVPSPDETASPKTALMRSGDLK